MSDFSPKTGDVIVAIASNPTSASKPRLVIGRPYVVRATGLDGQTVAVEPNGHTYSVDSFMAYEPPVGAEPEQTDEEIAGAFLQHASEQADLQTALMQRNDERAAEHLTLMRRSVAASEAQAAALGRIADVLAGATTSGDHPFRVWSA